ncbi:hypothetical protein U1Q18_046117 [Sarracenia purpurea var. burkii]
MLRITNEINSPLSHTTAAPPYSPLHTISFRRRPKSAAVFRSTPPRPLLHGSNHRLGHYRLLASDVALAV